MAGARRVERDTGTRSARRVRKHGDQKLADGRATDRRVARRAAEPDSVRDVVQLPGGRGDDRRRRPRHRITTPLGLERDRGRDADAPRDAGSTGMKRAFTILVVLVATVTQAHAQTVEAQRFRMSVGPCVLSSGTGAPSAGAGVNCDLYVDTGGDLWMKIAGTWRDLNIGSGTPGTLTKWKTATSLQDTAISESGGAAIVNEAIGSPGYASQVSGWQISTAGAADVRYLFTDELRARLFAADQESVLAGSQRVTKSYSTIAQTFTCPAAGATATLWVNDAATFGDAAVFQANDWIVIHAMTRAAFGPFTIADCVGTVSAYADGSGANAGQQSWTFTRGSGASGGTMTGGTTVAVKQLAQDMGVSGNGYVETTAVDGANGVNAPYMQVVTWATAPTSGNLTTRCRYGNIVGITGLSNEYGFLCGDLTGLGHYVRLSNLVAEIRDIPVNLLDASSNKVIALDPSGPSFAMGNPIPVSYTGANSGLWAGRDSDGVYKLRIGGAAGNRVQWDGTTLSIAGNGSGVTSINGGNIQTGTVTATQIAASTITATQIATNTITANQIASGTITSNQIASNSIHVGSLIATGQGDNVIHNGNFEGVDATSGLAGWFVEGTGQTYTWGCCGTTGPGALLVPQLVNGGNQWISASYYAAPVNAGQTYLLAFDVYSGVATGAGGITIFLNGSKQTTNAYIRYIRSTAGATAPDVTVDTQTVIAQPTLPAGWTHLEYTLTVPSGVTWMAPWFQFTGCYYQVGCSLMALDGVQFTQQLGPGSIKANSIT